jgi:hypothetical protein
MIDQSATELKLFIDNEADLYPQRVSIVKNLATKKARGAYKRDLAVKAFDYVVEAGAKKYVKDFGSPGQPWHQLFPVSTRKVVAKALTSNFEAEYALGNYDYLLPKKYQEPKTRAHARRREGEPKFAVGDIVRRTAARMRSMGLASGPVNGIVVGYSGPWPLIRWSSMDESDEPMAQAEEGLELDKRAAARRGHARRRVDLGTHAQLHEPDALRSATDRQLRGFYRDEQRDVAKARAEAARRGVTLHARKSRARLSREIAQVLGGRRI